MDDTKVIITDDDIYGFEILSPEFKPEIKVKFALDIPQSKRRGIREIIDSVQSMVKDKDSLTEEEQKQTGEQSRKYGEMLVQAVVLDWNIYGTDGSKLPINADTIDNRLSTRLAEWISTKAMSFFTVPSKTGSV